MITLEFINAVRGDGKMFIEDGDPEERRKMAVNILRFLKEGQAIFLIQGDQSHRIQGYDAETNQWILLSDVQKPPKRPEASERRGRRSKRLPAGNTQVTVLGASAGG